MRGGLGKNVVIVLALVGAGFFAAYLRFRPHLGHAATWTDGDVTYSTTASERVRHAIWERPAALAGGVNTAAREGRPAISPDGRWLVFSVGRVGLGADLWIAELGAGEARDPRPLSALNTAGDECAPAFGPGAADGGVELLFASNRAGGAGGLDLWRARFDDGRVADPRPLATVNGPFDETDPARGPAGELVFASNRRPPCAAAADFDLYRRAVAAPGSAEVAGADATAAVEPLDALNTPADEREPALDAAGRTLVFARDTGSERGFDLYRSMLDRGAWLPAEPIADLNTALHERGPVPSSDGFALVYAREDRAGDSDLWTARSRELFRVPSRPVGWIDLLVLLGLVLLALLAWLAKRWETIDVLYRCVLVSLIAHLLLLWWFRDLYPDRDEFALGTGTERTFRVQLASLADARAAAERANAERAGAVAIERRESSAAGPGRANPDVPSGADGPAARSFEIPRLAGAEAALPTPGESEPARPESAAASAVELTTGETFERLRGEAGTVALDARPLDVVRALPAGRPERAGVVVARSGAPTARRSRAIAPAAGPALPAVDRGPVAAERPRSAAVDRDERVAIRPPAESFERLAGEAVAFAVDPALAEVAHERGSSAAEPPERAEAIVQAAPDPARPFARPIDAAPGRALAPVETPRPADVEPWTPLRERSNDLTLADAEPFEPVADESSGVASDAVALALQPTELEAKRSARAGGAPQRFRESSSAAPSLAPTPWTPSRVATLSAPGRPTAGREALETLARGPRPAAADVALADAEARTYPAPPVLAEPRSLEPPTPSIASHRGERQARSAVGPRRWTADEERQAPAPLVRSVTSLDEPERDRTLERDDLDHTPYRSRFGRQKDIALDLYGGTIETERAVAAGLAYLAGRQRRGGGWSDPDVVDSKYGRVAVGKTGLALLAFLGAGHTPSSSTTYSAHVARAVRWLLAQQDADTGHFGDTSSYSHGIATYALAECHALTEDSSLRAPLEAAIEEILRHQYERGPNDPRSGGWGYFYPSGRRYDDWPRVSVTAWQVMALESARLGGLVVPDAAFEAAHRFLAGSFDRRRGWVRYSHDPDRLRSSVPTLPGSTPAALFALSLLGEDLNAEAWTPLRAFVSERAPRRYRMRSEDGFLERGDGNLYFWYYGTLAQFRAGGDAWKRWNVAMQETLLAAQEPEGSWAVSSIYARDYARDTNEERIYSTAMCVLTLEVYYRYFTPLLEVR